MFRPILLTVSLLLSVSGWAGPKEKMAANLLKRCEDGVAVSCFDYAKHLSASRKKTDKRKAGTYFRRACTLAYAPACKSNSIVAVTKPPVKAPPKAADQDDVCSGEKLLKTAVLPGDTVIRVNDEAFNSNDQIIKAVDNGGATLSILRKGHEATLSLSCPK